MTALQARCAYCRRVYRDGPTPETTGACDTCREHVIESMRCKGGSACDCIHHTFLRGVFDILSGGADDERLEAVLLRGQDVRRLERRGEVVAFRIDERPEYTIDRGLLDRLALALGCKVIDAARPIAPLTPVEQVALRGLPEPHTTDPAIEAKGKGIGALFPKEHADAASLRRGAGEAPRSSEAQEPGEPRPRVSSSTEPALCSRCGDDGRVEPVGPTATLLCAGCRQGEEAEFTALVSGCLHCGSTSPADFCSDRCRAQFYRRDHEEIR